MSQCAGFTLVHVAHLQGLLECVESMCSVYYNRLGHCVGFTRICWAKMWETRLFRFMHLLVNKASSVRGAYKGLAHCVSNGPCFINGENKEDYNGVVRRIHENIKLNKVKGNNYNVLSSPPITRKH